MGTEASVRKFWDGRAYEQFLDVRPTKNRFTGSDPHGVLSDSDSGILYAALLRKYYYRTCAAGHPLLLLLRTSVPRAVDGVAYGILPDLPNADILWNNMCNS